MIRTEDENNFSKAEGGKEEMNVGIQIVKE